MTDAEFSSFRANGLSPRSLFTCLTEYDSTIDAPVAFEKEFPQNVLADVLAGAGLRQFHIAETEKYAHVTFSLNGGVERRRSEGRGAQSHRKSEGGDL